MQVNLREVKGISILEFSGCVDFESTEHFKINVYPTLVKKKRKFIFDLKNLRFVGSSNIRNFLFTINSLAGLENKPKYCRVSLEFIKMVQAYFKNEVEIFNTAEQARASFASQRKKSRPRATA